MRGAPSSFKIVQLITRLYSIAWGYHLGSLALWILAGLLLGLPALLRLRSSGSRLRLHWPTFAVHALPGLFLTLALPLWMVGLAPLGNIALSSLLNGGGQYFGALLVGFGLAQALLAGSETNSER